jgi:hypothetical protein
MSLAGTLDLFQQFKQLINLGLKIIGSSLTEVGNSLMHVIADQVPIFRRPRRDSNPQPTDSKSGALSIELRGHGRDYTQEIRNS